MTQHPAERRRESGERWTPLPTVLTHPRMADAVVLATVLTFAIGHDIFDPPDHPVWLCLLVDLALALPLIFRHGRPMLTFLAVSAIALAQWGIGLLVTGDIAVLAALYAVGVYERRWRNVALAAVIAELGVVMAVTRWSVREQWLTGIILSTGTVTASWVLGRYVRTHRAYVASVLERAATAERQRDQQAHIAMADERARISREMHDIVAHSLSVMIALGDGAAISMDAEPETARAGMRQSSALGRQALGELRRVLATGHDTDEAALVPQPGIADLDDLVAKVRSAGLPVDLVVVGRSQPLPPGAQLTIYRMVQEALTNVLKHAPAATRTSVLLRYLDDAIELEVENDDPGPRGPASGPEVVRSLGSGLTGMRERAAVFGGTVEAAPRRGGGWRVASQLHLQDGGV